MLGNQKKLEKHFKHLPNRKPPEGGGGQPKAAPSTFFLVGGQRPPTHLEGFRKVVGEDGPKVFFESFWKAFQVLLVCGDLAGSAHHTG